MRTLAIVLIVVVWISVVAVKSVKTIDRVYGTRTQNTVSMLKGNL